MEPLTPQEWTVAVSETLVDALRRDLAWGYLDDEGHRTFEDHLVDTFDGLKIEIFSNEHPPPHFRVHCQGKSDNFAICTGLPIPGMSGALKKVHGNIRAWAEKNRAALVQTWNNTRPTDCPVGPTDCP